MAASLVIGVNGHLTRRRRPTVCLGASLRSHMALLTRQVGRETASRSSLLEIIPACHVTRIGMTVLTFANQCVAIIMMHGSRHSVAGITTARCHRRYAFLTGRVHQLPSQGHGVKCMTGTARVVNPAVGHINWHPCRGPRCGRMTGGTWRDIGDEGAVVDGHMTGQTIVCCRRPRIVMNSAHRVGHRRMTVKAAGDPRIRQCLGKQGAAIAASTLGAAAIRIEMTQPAVTLVDVDRDINTAMAGATSASPGEIPAIVATVGFSPVSMAVNTGHCRCVHNHIADRSVGTAHVCGSRGIMAQNAAPQMHG